MDDVIVNRVGASEICCFRYADKFLRSILIVTSLKTVSFVFIALGMPYSTQLLGCVCVYSECVSILLRWVLELFTFVKGLAVSIRRAMRGHFFWVLCSRILLGA